jgi:hypothetical protein
LQLFVFMPKWRKGELFVIIGASGLAGLWLARERLHSSVTPNSETLHSCCRISI